MDKTYDFNIFLDDRVCQKIKSGVYKKKKSFKNFTSYDVAET